MKTRWLAFAVAGSQLVARTRYSNERCVSNVAAEVLPDAVDVRCLCGTAMTPALLKGPMQRGTLLQKTAWTRGRAQSGGLFVSGFGSCCDWAVIKKRHKSVCTRQALQKTTVLKQADSAAGSLLQK